MKTTIKQFILFLSWYVFLTHITIISPCQGQNYKEKDIPFINSFSADDVWTNNLITGLNKELTNRFESYHIYNEYLDSRHFDYNHIKDSIKVALVNRPPLIECIEKTSWFAFDYIKLLADEIGIKMDFNTKYSSAEILYNSIGSGDDVDLIITASRTVEREKYLLFTEPWLTLQYALFVRSEENLLFYNGLNSLEGKTIAREVGSQVHELLKNDYQVINLMPVECAECGIKAVQANKAFAWLGDHTVGLHLIEKLGFDKIKVGTSVHELGKHRLSIAVNKNKPVLFEILKKAMNQIPKTKIIALRQKYSGNIDRKTELSLDKTIEYGFIFLLFLTFILTVLFYKLKIAKDNIIKKEEDLRITFDSIGNGIIVTDCNKIIIRMNKKSEELIGCKSEEARGAELSTIYNAINSRALKLISAENFKDDIFHNTSTPQYASITSIFGKQYKIIDNAAPIIDKNNHKIGFVIVFSDVTHQFDKEQQMLKAEQDRQIILDNITVGVCFYDKKLYPIKYNKQMLNYCGKGPESSLTGGFFSTLAEDDEDNFTLEKPVTFTVCKGDTPDGKDGYEYEVTGLPIIENDEIVGILEIVVDISEHRTLQNELEKASQELKEYSRNLEQQVEARTTELSTNNHQLDNILKELKYTQGKIILSEKMSALRQLISGIAKDINIPLATIEESSRVAQNHFSDIITDLEQLNYPEENAEENIIFEMLSKGINNMIDSPEQTAEEASQAKKMCIEKLKKHDIDNTETLSNILVSLKMEQELEKYTEAISSTFLRDIATDITRFIDIQICCNSIKKSVENASQIVLALKNYVSQSNQTDKKIHSIKNVNIKNGIETVLTLFHNKTDKHITIEENFADDLHEISGISDELNQVWTNLIQNAIDAMPDGGELKIVAFNNNGGVLIEVKDTGIGMTSEEKDNLFNPISITKSKNNSGLGMEITRRIIVDNHQGKIEVESEPGQGTTISIWLPFKQEEVSSRVKTY